MTAIQLIQTLNGRRRERAIPIQLGQLEQIVRNGTAEPDWSAGCSGCDCGPGPTQREMDLRKRGEGDH